MAGAAAGWLAGSAAELRAGPGFPAFQRRLRPGHQRLSPRGGDVAPHQRAGVGGLLRNAGPDLLELRAHAQGLRPHPGHGLSARGLPTAGRGLGRADRGAGPAGGEDLQDRPGRQEPRDVQRPVVPVERQRLQLQLDVRDARRFRAAADAGACTPTRSPTGCGRSSPGRCPRPWWSSSGRRRSAAWAARAGSSSWWKTGETSV